MNISSKRGKLREAFARGDFPGVGIFYKYFQSEENLEAYGQKIYLVKLNKDTGSGAICAASGQIIEKKYGV